MNVKIVGIVGGHADHAVASDFRNEIGQSLSGQLVFSDVEIVRNALQSSDIGDGKRDVREIEVALWSHIVDSLESDRVIGLSRIILTTQRG